NAADYAYRDRRDKKAEFRRLWIARINAAARQEGVSYSRFVAGLRKAGVTLDRKVLADLALRGPEAFKALVPKAQSPAHPAPTDRPSRRPGRPGRLRRAPRPGAGEPPRRARACGPRLPGAPRVSSPAPGRRGCAPRRARSPPGSRTRRARPPRASPARRSRC